MKEREKIEVTADMVITALNIQVLSRTGREIFVTCPFCGDSRKKAAFTVAKGLFHCVVCEKGGNAWSVYKELTGLDKSEAFKQLLKGAGDVTYQSSSINIPEDELAAEPEVLDKTYRELMKICSLEERHKQDLLRRGLTEEQIKKVGFCSMPKYTESTCKKLLAKGVTLSHVPGFYVNRNGNWDMFSQGAGYFCPVYDTEKNYVVGFQIRMDKEKDGRKYLWFSTAGYKEGTKSGSQACYLRGKNRDITIVTEGILKATVTYFLLGQAVSVIGVPGISTTVCAEKFFHHQTFLVEAYDMDKTFNISDASALSELLGIWQKRCQKEEISFKDLFKDTSIKDKYASIWRAININNARQKLLETFDRLGKPYHQLVWNTKNEFWKGEIKGIDDFLLSYPDKNGFLAFLSQKYSEAQALDSFLNN